MRTPAWVLASRPDPHVCTDNFSTVEVDVPDVGKFHGHTILTPLGSGEVLLKVHFLSVDPYMRGRMNDLKGHYISAFQIGAPIESGGVGEVISSNCDRFVAGDVVSGFFAWKKVLVIAGASLTKVTPVPGLELSAYLGVFGVTGLSAYFPIVEIGQPKAGETGSCVPLAPNPTAFVSGAAGAVGSIAGQILKAMGCKVIGSAGTEEKVQWLRSIGFDSAFNYKEVDTAEALQQVAPDGIDIYFDNVGGETLDKTLNQMKTYGRIIACGGISQYDVAPSDRFAAIFISDIKGTESSRCSMS